MNYSYKLSCAGAILLIAFGSVRAPAAIRNLQGFNTTVYGVNDDGSYPCTSSQASVPPSCTPTPVPIGFTINFYNTLLTELYVNNNGNVTFGGPLSEFTPFEVAANETSIIAPFFADVDTRSGNLVTFGNDVVDGHAAFGVNWIGVGYFDQEIDKLNSFQLVIIDRSDRNPGDFDIEFNYDQVQWETGDASDGVDGLGGVSAVVGFSNGSGLPGTSFQLHGSQIPGQFLDSNPGGLIHRSLNSAVLGRYIIPVVNLTNTVLSVPLFSQGDPKWASNIYGSSGSTIQQKGCALASLAMALKYEGISTDPAALNTLLKNNSDFVGSSVNWTAAARDASGDTLEFHSFRTSDLQYLSQALSEGHPVIVGVNLDEDGAPSHFVVVTGYRNGQYLINDPGHANFTTLDSYNNVFETRGYVGDPAGDVSGLGFGVDNPAELLVVDPVGRRAGYVSGQVIEEIPRGFHFLDAVENNDLTGAPGSDTAHQVDLYQPAQGIYQIFLLGTHSGNYKLTVRSYSQSGTPGTPLNFTGAITPGAVVPLQVILGPGGLTAQPFTNQCPWSATPTNGTSPLSVQFSSPGVDAQGNSITAWNWNFADGTSSTSQNPSHTYNSGGIFFPSLTVINSTGATVVGAGPAITIPLVRFTASPTNGVPPMMVQFTCPATDNLGNPLTQWTWGFGDGASSSQQNPSHIYTSIGAFAPTLSAVNNLGVTVTGQGPRISVLPYSGIVLNGGFETGDLTDWAQSGDTMFIGVDSDPSDVHSDSYGAYIGTSDIAPGYLSQPLRTTPGEPYLISLWLDSPDGEIPNEFSVAWQGTTVFDAVDLPAIGWTNIQLLVTANSPTTSLRFGYVNEISFFGLDEITVLPVRPVITGISLSGQDLVLKATNGLDGRAYRVLRSSSASLPLNQWTSIATNTIAGSGNFILTIPNAVDPSAAQRFFRIQLQ